MNRFFMTLVMLAIFAGMVGVAMTYPAEARSMPFVVGIPGIALCLFQLFLDVRAGRQVKSGMPTDTRNEFEKAQAQVSEIVGRKMEFDMAHETTHAVVSELPQEGEQRREIVIWACFLGLVSSIILFGFWPTIPVFFVLFFRYFVDKSWAFSVGLGATGSAVLFLVFSKALGMSLHAGFITEMVLERLGGG